MSKSIAPELSVEETAAALLESIEDNDSEVTQEVELDTDFLDDDVDVEEASIPAVQPAVVAKKAATKDTILFSDLGLHPDVLRAVQGSGYEAPTPIQAQIIPHVLAGRDVLAQSQTGSGKTAAFALPILSRLDPEQREVQVLVLAPTRELAIQVANSFSTYSAEMSGVRVAAIYGGQDYEVQFRQLRQGVQVVVGTPGRVIDHVNRGTLDLSSIKCLVLDEADEMLNMGFLEDVQFVLQKSPANRQIALFSATLPEAIREIAHEYLTDHVKVAIKSRTLTAESIRQRALFVQQHNKIDVLKRILEAETTDGVIVFAKTKDSTITIAEQLSREGFAAVALNGDMAQKVRERTIEQLKSGALDILVATDVAARGLDVPRISHVFNYDLPHDSEGYIHRIGRTGRAGRSGEAIIFLTNAQRGKLRLIERATKQTIEIEQPPTADAINAFRMERFKQRITDVIASDDLSLFEGMLEEYCNESGKSPTLVAAALAQIAQNGRPFFVKDIPASSNQGRERRNSRDRNDFEQDNSGYDRRRIGPAPEGMLRFRLDVGRRDGVQPRNIVGAVANEGNINSRYIGPIKIYDTYTTIDLPSDLPRDICQTLRRTWVAGRQLNMRPYDEEDRRPRDDYQSDRGPARSSSQGSRPAGKKFSKRSKAAN